MRLSLSTEVVVYELGVGNIKWWGSKGRDAISRNMFVHTFCFFFTQTTCHIRHWRRLLLLYNYKYKSSLPINQATSSKSHNFGNRVHDLNFHILLYQLCHFFSSNIGVYPRPKTCYMKYIAKYRTWLPFEYFVQWIQSGGLANLTLAKPHFSHCPNAIRLSTHCVVHASWFALSITVLFMNL